MTSISMENLLASYERERHLNRVQKSIRQAHRLINSCDDVDMLIAGICVNLTENMGYYNAWIALFDKTKSCLKVSKAASAGFKSGSFKVMRERLFNGVFPDCMKRTVKKDQIQIIKNPLSDCPDCPLSVQYSGRSGLTSKLVFNDHCYGIISVSVPAEFSSDLEEQELFYDIVQDISFALSNIEVNKQLHLFQNIVKTVPQPMSFINPDYTYQAVNDVYAQFHGIPPEKIIGHKITDFLDKKIFESEVKPHIDSCFKGNRVQYDVEVNFKGKKGIRWMQMSYFPYKDESGNVTGVVSHGLDITAQKRAEESLRDSEEKFYLAFNTSPYAITITRMSDGRMIDVNDAFSTISGYTKKEALESSSILLKLWVNEEDRNQVINDLSNRIPVFGKECIFRKKSGELFTGLFFASVITVNNEKCVVSSINDITKRKQLEDEFKKRGNLLQKIFEILPIGLWIADKNGRLLDGNPAGVSIWGAKPDVGPSEYGVFKARRLPSREEIAPDDWALIYTIRDGVTVVDELLEIDAFDGKKKTILNYSAPIFDDCGKIEGALVINQDISERERLQSQLVQAQKMESVGRLAGGVAHDFNNMLMVIMGYAEISINMLNPDNPIYENLVQILNAAQRSSDITRQLLAFARKQAVYPKVININQSIENMLKMLKRLIGENIHLKFQPSKDLWHINIDPSQIDQILANLCVNARDAINGVGNIIIQTCNITCDESYCLNYDYAKQGEYVLLTVSDDGCGISKEDINNIFEPFFTTKAVGKGTGLGLSTVYGIVKQNNGFINVYSEHGIGTTFKAYLPKHIDTIEPNEQENKEHAEYGHETILIVEDEQTILNMAKIMLEKLGYNVLTADLPSKAVDIAKNYAGEIELLITDVIMPEMNGQELFSNISRLIPYQF